MNKLTVSGGLIVLGLFMNNWSVSTALEKFIVLAEKAFRPRISKLIRLPFSKRFIQYMLACLMDSQYGAGGIEEALKASFGENRTMLDSTSKLSTKVAVTATTVAETMPCLFANYTIDKFRDGNTLLYT